MSIGHPRLLPMQGKYNIGPYWENMFKLFRSETTDPFFCVSIINPRCPPPQDTV